MGTAVARSESNPDIRAHAAVFGMASEAVDGMDVVAVEAAALRAAHAIRRGEGPRFLETKTYRFRAHSMFDPDLYREKREIEEWKKRDPIAQFEEWILATGLVHEDDVAALEGRTAREIEAAVTFAEAAPWEPVEDLARDVYTPLPATTA
jgi:TPP-dependent pyruvate/acetoin dehydrogenase alpha subunit